MSWNVRAAAGGDDAYPLQDRSENVARIAEVIRESGADIAGLQEVDRFWSRSGGGDQPHVLAEALGMDVAFAPNWLPEGGRQEDGVAQYGVALLSRIPIETSRHVRFDTPPGWEPRGALIVTVRASHAKALRLAVTHLQVDPPDQDGAAQDQRADALATMIEQLGDTEGPVAVLGDFNADPGSLELNVLEREGSDWRDCWTAMHHDDPGYTIPALVSSQPTRRIDYLWVNGALHVEAAEVVVDDRTRLASDHYPVVADLAFG